MNFLSSLLNGLLIAFVPLAVLLADNANRSQILFVFGAVIFAVFGLAVGVRVFRAILAVLHKRKQQQPTIHPILVDGSNVMHWGGTPSIVVLYDVLMNLTQRGYTPMVYFDANVGYKLFDRYANDTYMAGHLGLRREQVEVVPKGVIADEKLLEVATEHNLLIVTNDRFLDWQSQFPRVADHGFLIKGRWTDGDVIWRFPQDLVLSVAA